MFVATDADGPVGEAALEEPVRPPSRDEDVGGVGDVLVREHAPHNLHDLCLGLAVRLLLDPPRLLVGHRHQEHIGIRVLLLKLLPDSVVASPGARVEEELPPCPFGPEFLGELDEYLGVHGHVELDIWT
ncbi:Os09g0368400 [Oryza sativa Japonica Group]|uniref:Os09g0368400 protein n=1 Tax=Oryza sativa subsp. japonica TaxID=39947 RepID=A0A0P0XLB7_ORYSJ|nr:Os09g0368400 [Oryza sativa Japonica Group]